MNKKKSFSEIFNEHFTYTFITSAIAMFLIAHFSFNQALLFKNIIFSNFFITWLMFFVADLGVIWFISGVFLIIYSTFKYFSKDNNKKCRKDGIEVKHG